MMAQSNMRTTSAVLPFGKTAGVIAPTALGSTSMRQQTLDEVSSDVQCPTCGDAFDSKVAMKAHHQHHELPYYEAVIQRKYGVPAEWYIDTLHNVLGQTMAEVGEPIGTSASTIQEMASRHGVETRNLSEAKEVEWRQLGEEGRRARLDAPHEKTRELVDRGEHNLSEYWDGLSESERRELTEAARKEHFGEYGEGGYIAQWVQENPEKHQEVAATNAHLGTVAREENGMAGVTGQDHPGWRGGKSVYDAVKKLLGDESWATTRNRTRDQAGGECEMCGRAAAEIEHRDLDVHHVVPLLCGGTNDDWNLMALCHSCHHRAEWYTRDLLDPVLTE